MGIVVTGEFRTAYKKLPGDIKRKSKDFFSGWEERKWHIMSVMLAEWTSIRKFTL